MNAVHVNELKDPSKEFPKAMFVAMILVLLILILPPLVISWFIPAEQLSLTAGVMQAFDAVFAHFGMQFLTPIVGLAIVSASLAGFMTWLSGPSRSLLLVSQEGGFLPPWFQRTNEQGVQVNILAAQGVVTTILALLFAFVPAVSDAYWMFMTITTSVYLLMYLWLFMAAYNLRKRQPDHPRGYRAPALTLLCVLGFASSLAAILISFVPPSQFGGGSPAVFVLIVGGGILLLGAIIPFLLVKFRKPSWKPPPSVLRRWHREASDHLLDRRRRPGRAPRRDARPVQLQPVQRGSGRQGRAVDHRLRQGRAAHAGGRCRKSPRSSEPTVGLSAPP